MYPAGWLKEGGVADLDALLHVGLLLVQAILKAQHVLLLLLRISLVLAVVPCAHRLGSTVSLADVRGQLRRGKITESKLANILCPNMV